MLSEFLTHNRVYLLMVPIILYQKIRRSLVNITVTKIIQQIVIYPSENQNIGFTVHSVYTLYYIFSKSVYIRIK